MAYRGKSAGWVLGLLLGSLLFLPCDALALGRSAHYPRGPVTFSLVRIADEVAVLGEDASQGIVGKKVLSRNHENMGQIVNVIVDRGGRPRAAVVDFGGFLGVGSRKIAVDWDALTFTPKDGTDEVTLDLTRDELKAAPAYQEGKPVVVIGATGKTQSVPSTELQ